MEQQTMKLIVKVEKVRKRGCENFIFVDCMFYGALIYEGVEELIDENGILWCKNHLNCSMLADSSVVARNFVINATLGLGESRYYPTIEISEPSLSSYWQYCEQKKKMDRVEQELNRYMRLSYDVVISKIPHNQGGGWHVCIPRLGRHASCADGETPEDALESLEEIKKMLLREYLEEGVKIPEPEREW